MRSKHQIQEKPEVARFDELRQLFSMTRVANGLDVETLASNASVSAAAVRSLEINPQNVPMNDLYAVANALNLDPGVVLELLHAAIR